MCPGGHVVAAQSEENTVVTNGMSYHARDGRNRNAALAVSVDPADFDDGTPLGGVAFQRRIERGGLCCDGGYRAPCQTVGDFLEGRASRRAGRVQPTYPGRCCIRLCRCLSAGVCDQPVAHRAACVRAKDPWL